MPLHLVFKWTKSVGVRSHSGAGKEKYKINVRKAKNGAHIALPTAQVNHYRFY